MRARKGSLMSSNQSGGAKGFSDADNELAGRLLLVGVAAIIGMALLAILPILIGGFFIGLIWYGAYMEDGEPNGERIVWPISITIVAFVYFLGLFPPLNQHYQGVLFTDFGKWTSLQVGDVLRAVNELLPRKFLIRSVSAQQLRIYGWSVIPVAMATFLFLCAKGAGRGVFLYQGCRLILAPIRELAVRWQLLFLISVAATAWLAIYNLPPWIKVATALSLGLLLIYSISDKSGHGSSAIDVQPKSTGSLQLGHEKGKTHKKATLTEEQLNHHVHIVGASGFGKSVLLSHVIKDRIAKAQGLLFVDLKADFETIRQVVSVVKASDRLEDLYIFSCGNPEISSPYNILGSGTANQLKDRIMGALNWSEEFYKNEASSFLLKLLRGLVVNRDVNETAFDLGTILKCAQDPREISSLVEALPKSELEIRGQLEGLVSHLSRHENKRALQGLKSQLESLLLSDFGHLLRANASGIDLFEAIKNQKIVYILLDSRTYGESSKALGKLILQDLKAASARVDNEIPRAQRTPFTVVVDEFADLATEDFIGFLDRARSSKIGVVVAHQEIADLSRLSPEFARRLMNATSTLFAFLQKLPDSSELISAISGTRKTKEVTEQAKSNWLFGDEKTGMKSIKEVDEFVIHPNVVRSLPVGECILVQKYPKAKSAVIKVKSESRDYLSETEVKNALAELGERDRFDGRAEKVSVVAQPPKAIVSQSESKSVNYWSDKIEPS